MKLRTPTDSECDPLLHHCRTDVVYSVYDELRAPWMLPECFIGCSVISIIFSHEGHRVLIRYTEEEELFPGGSALSGHSEHINCDRWTKIEIKKELLLLSCLLHL